MRSAVVLADRHNMRMGLVEPRSVRGHGCVESGLKGVITDPFRDDTRAQEYSPGVRIDDEQWPVKSVEEDIVDALRAETLDGEQRRARG